MELSVALPHFFEYKGGNEEKDLNLDMLTIRWLVGGDI